MEKEDMYLRYFERVPSCGGNNTAYISSSCNLTPHSADWGRNFNIAYAACNSVAIYDSKRFPGAGKVVATKHTNKGRVNVVQWFKQIDGSYETEIVLSSADGKIVVWNSARDTCTTLEGHSKSVNALDCLYLPASSKLSTSGVESQPAIVVSASADSTIKIWKRDFNTDLFVCTQTLNFKSGLCLSLRLCLLPGTQSVLLACGMDDAKIHLYTGNVVSFLSQEMKDVDNVAESRHFVKVDALTGHGDWVRAMDFCIDDCGDILLASGSQDTMIRVWRFSPSKNGGSRPSEDIQAEQRTFTVADDDNVLHCFTFSIESVMAGHSGWIYGIAWQPSVFEDGKKTHQPLRLLSCSLDKTMVVWSPDPETGIWMDVVRVGGVGGNTLGFYGCKFSPDGLSIMGHGWQGAVHIWNYLESSDRWEPAVGCCGHFREAVDVGWEPEGRFLLSIGEDQTTRLHTPWVRDGNVSWHELARPQVHGYDMTCLAILSRYRFASGADEKVIRAFEAPRDFVDNLGRISRVTDKSTTQLASALGASVPALGLSNKAVYERQKEVLSERRHFRNEYPESNFVPTNLLEPPTEENLIQNTLWPEVQKLYGHGYEIFSLAARSDGKVLASACKASTTEFAAILLWDTDTWLQLQRLEAHQLTVTQMSFSPDGNSLLSVSRDRTWSIFELHPEDNSYVLAARTDKSTGIHSRIIWCCAWLHDGTRFATGSREGRLVLWGKCPGAKRTDSPLGEYGSIASFNAFDNTPVTAVCFAPDVIAPNTYLVAIGTETGNMVVANWIVDRPTELLVWRVMSTSMAHHLTVKRLAFRPVFGKAGYEGTEDDACVLQLASCGSDHAVKVHNVDLKQERKYEVIKST